MKNFKKLDTIKISIGFETYKEGEETSQFLTTKVSINGKEIDQYVSIHSLLGTLGETHSRQGELYNTHVFDKKLKEYVKRKDYFPPSSNFYPFTCSCGVAGCDGIWEGIFQKTKKYTVEWKIYNKDENGYRFLDKSFYKFDRNLYIEELKKVWKYIVENKDLEIDDYGDKITVEKEFSYLVENYPEIIKQFA